MIISVQKDVSKAKMLLDMAIITFARLNETDIEKYPSNSLTDYYDIIHKLLEGLSCIDGVKFKGDGAHQELIDYVCKNYQLPEQDRIFLQEVRDFRNRISYEGFMLNKNFISRNKDKLTDIITRFEMILKTKLLKTVL